MKTGVVLAVAMTIAAESAAQTSIRTTSEQQLRQEKISIMEGTLTSSVGVATQRVLKGVKSIDSTAALFAGQARAKGFTLEGHGVFFYVEVPTLDLTVMMTVQQFERERSAQQRAEAPQPGGDPQPVNNLRLDSPAPLPPLPTAVETLANLAAEGQKWRSTVRLALIDAMLDNSKNLELKPEEWLTIAARGSETELMPNEILNLTTTVLRVKGSDLADFLAGRLTKEEARLKVEVREF